MIFFGQWQYTIYNTANWQGDTVSSKKKDILDLPLQKNDHNLNHSHNINQKKNIPHFPQIFQP